MVVSVRSYTGRGKTSLAAEAADDTDYMPSLRINEVKTSSGGKADDADVFDWIELYNDGEDTVDLTGYGLIRTAKTNCINLNLTARRWGRASM